jgi:hypothetical protein
MKYLVISLSILSGVCFLNSCQNEKENKANDKELPPPKDMFLDAEAEKLLDGMSKVLGELTSCSFTVNSAEMYASDTAFSATKQVDVYFKSNDKMYVYSVSEKGENAYWYDGAHLSFYSFTKNTYDSISAPSTTMEMIDQINADYGIKFPAADFFYPSLTDDLVEISDSILYIGDTTVNENEIAVVKCVSEKMKVFIFINKSTELPAGMYINDLEKNEKYKASLKNWQVNPNLDDVIFEFSAPKGSSRAIINRKEK